VDEGLAIGFLSPRFDCMLPQIVDQGMAENAAEPGHGILTTPQRGSALYGSENTLLEEVLRHADIPRSVAQKR
jgi:hypothetical protein